MTSEDSLIASRADLDVNFVQQQIEQESLESDVYVINCDQRVDEAAVECSADESACSPQDGGEEDAAEQQVMDDAAQCSAVESAGTPVSGGGSSNHSRSNSGRSTVEQLCRVAFSFTGCSEDSTQLSLRQGDLVRVQCRDSSGWSYGRLEVLSSQHNTNREKEVGAVGWLPQALLEELSAEEEEMLQKDKSAQQLSTAEEQEKLASRSDSKRSSHDSGFTGISAAASRQLAKSNTQESIRLTDEILKVQDALDMTPSSLATPDVSQVRGTRSATSLGMGTTDGAGQPRSENREARKLRQCEQRLLKTASNRKRCLGAFARASNGTSEAEEAVETALRTLQNLEEQEQKCRVEASCVASSPSKSMHQSAMMKLRLLESRKRDALVNLEIAQEKLEAERCAQDHLRAQLRNDSRKAAAAFEALSSRRARSGRVIRTSLHPSSWTNSEPLPETSIAAAEPADKSRKRSSLQNQSNNKQQSEPARKACDSPKPGVSSPKACSGNPALAESPMEVPIDEMERRVRSLREWGMQEASAQVQQELEERKKKGKAEPAPGSCKATPEGLPAGDLTRSRQGLNTRGAPPPRTRPSHGMQLGSTYRSRSTSRGAAARQDSIPRDASARSRTASHESMLRSASMQQSLVAKSRSESRERQRAGNGTISGGSPPPMTAQFITPAQLASPVQYTTQGGRSPSQDCPQRQRSVSRQRSLSSQRSLSRGGSTRSLDLRKIASPGREQNENRNIQKTPDSTPTSPETPSGGNSKQVRSLLEVVQAAQSLQAKLAGMPEHLRGPVSRIGSTRYPQRAPGTQKRV